MYVKRGTIINISLNSKTAENKAVNEHCVFRVTAIMDTYYNKCFNMSEEQ